MLRTKAYLFVFGGSSTLLLSMFLFVILPRLQIRKIDNQTLSAQDAYTQSQLLGRHTYQELGCVYCHTQQVRDPSAGADASFGWGRPSLPSDYIYDKPHLLGTMRTGPDLSNIGSRQPSRDWHHLHLFNPRLLVKWSIMPGFAFLYEKISQFEEGAIKLPDREDQWIRPTARAQALVNYLLSLKRDREPRRAGEHKP